MKHKSSQSGQILLIVVLSIVVALTVGLSVASRTISNLRISKQNEESQRAFQAAEAGLELATQALSQGSSGNLASGLDNTATYQVEVQSEGGNEIILNGENLVQRSVGLDVWMSNHDDYSSPFRGSVILGFGSPGQDCSSRNKDYAPALEVLYIYGDPNAPQFRRDVYDPCRNISGRISNATGGSAGATTIAGTQFPFSINLNLSSDPSNILIMKVIPIYNSTKLGIRRVSGNRNLPAQGSTIVSTGRSGDTVRKITYFQSHPQIPNELFPYAIISQ